MAEAFSSSRISPQVGILSAAVPAGRVLEPGRRGNRRRRHVLLRVAIYTRRCRYARMPFGLFDHLSLIALPLALGLHWRPPLLRRGGSGCTLTDRSPGVMPLSRFRRCRRSLARPTRARLGTSNGEWKLTRATAAPAEEMTDVLEHRYDDGVNCIWGNYAGEEKSENPSQEHETPGHPTEMTDGLLEFVEPRLDERRLDRVHVCRQHVRL